MNFKLTSNKMSLIHLIIHIKFTYVNGIIPYNSQNNSKIIYGVNYEFLPSERFSAKHTLTYA